MKKLRIHPSIKPIYGINKNSLKRIYGINKNMACWVVRELLADVLASSKMEASDQIIARDTLKLIAGGIVDFSMFAKALKDTSSRLWNLVDRLDLESDAQRHLYFALNYLISALFYVGTIDGKNVDYIDTRFSAEENEYQAWKDLLSSLRQIVYIDAINQGYYYDVDEPEPSDQLMKSAREILRLM